MVQMASCLLTRLHAHEGAPYEHGRAIQQPSNNVTEKQHEVSPILRDVCCKVLFQPLYSRRGIRVFAGQSAEKRRFLVGRGAA